MYKYWDFKIVLLVLQFLPPLPPTHPHPPPLYPPTLGEGGVTAPGGEELEGEGEVEGEVEEEVTATGPS